MTRKACVPFVKKFKPTPDMKQMVCHLVVVDTPLDIIIEIIQEQFDAETKSRKSERLTEESFREYFSFELRAAKHILRARVASALFRKAMETGKDSALIGWLKFYSKDIEDGADTDGNKHIVFMESDTDIDKWINKESIRTKKRPLL